MYSLEPRSSTGGEHVAERAELVVLLEGLERRASRGFWGHDVIDTWIWYRRTNHVDAPRLRPHRFELVMYYDI